MDYVRDALMKKYALQLCRYEMAKYEGRQTRLNGKMQQYFNSTPVKNAFARLMYIAANVKSLYTKTAIATELHITRQASHQMINECIQAGWIEIDEGGRCPTYKANPRLGRRCDEVCGIRLRHGRGHRRGSLSSSDQQLR